MSEVYRARDTRLDRDVAIKLLPEAFAHDPERLARLEREAKTLAALNHANIGAIYGIEEAPAGDAGVASGSSRTIHALILELVNGPTLADRIAEGPVPLDDVAADGRFLINVAVDRDAVSPIALLLNWNPERPN